MQKNNKSLAKASDFLSQAKASDFLSLAKARALFNNHMAIE